MNIYRWALIIIAAIVGIGNIMLIDKNNLSFENNVFEYLGSVSMFGVSIWLATQNLFHKNEKKSF
ncbi:hypothetical protein HGP29_23490 [Flammeovirga sp. SR4]|uniref:Uncharacterized protein n=1 Tax=Flammeovirga agarivorans TaxID=2726742 RepID=A0A7X8XYG1_9BACT|nr:hypothetical protein [Flammeovirga sp. SubArs3]NLR94187.1 hypothetical protein [Flammeovirga agarivorans]